MIHSAAATLNVDEQWQESQRKKKDTDVRRNEDRIVARIKAFFHVQKGLTLKLEMRFLKHYLLSGCNQYYLKMI